MIIFRADYIHKRKTLALRYTPYMIVSIHLNEKKKRNMS